MVSMKLKFRPSAIEGKEGTNPTLFCYMEKIIVNYRSQGQYRTSETYSTTLNSFKRFRVDTDVNLVDIDSGLMEAYESYLKRSGLSPNTISFYLKHGMVLLGFQN